jgi:hypothetical protein
MTTEHTTGPKASEDVRRPCRAGSRTDSPCWRTATTTHKGVQFFVRFRFFLYTSLLPEPVTTNRSPRNSRVENSAIVDAEVVKAGGLYQL